MASPLETLQRRFIRSAVFMPDPAFVSSVTGGGKLSARAAVEVYAKGYPARLTEALGETYEGTWRVLGDEQFFQVADAYIHRFPSISYNLSDYGVSFPDFLRCQVFDSFDCSALGDLAAFEWEFKELFHTKPHQGLSAADLAAKVKPDSRFGFGGARRVLSLAHSVYAIWRRDRDDDTPIEESAWDGPERLALYKKEGNPIFVRQLTAPEHAALVALVDGKTLDDALSSAEGMDEAAAGTLFGFLAESGLVTEVL